MVPLLNTLEEPFAPTGKIALVWQVAAALRVDPSPFVSSASFLNVYNAWLHVLTSTLILPVHSNKVMANTVSHVLLFQQQHHAKGPQKDYFVHVLTHVCHYEQVLGYSKPLLLWTSVL